MGAIIAGSRRGGLTLRVLGADRAREATDAWRLLEQRVQEPPLTCSWDWTGTWLAHYGDVVPHEFALAERAGEPVAIALVTRGVRRRRGPIRIRTLHVGTAGEPEGESVYVERNRLLALPGERPAFAAELAAELGRRRGVDEIALYGFHPGDAAAFLAARPTLEAERLPSWTFDLAAARGGEVLDALRGSVRRRIRRSMRGLGEPSGEWAETPGHALAILEELIELHQRRWSSLGEPGAFASRRFRAFHRALVARLLPQGRAVLFRAAVEGRTLGCVYGLVDGDRVLSYQSGMGASEDNRLKPGLVTYVLCMQACLERGFGAFDLLTGDSRYKRELATGAGELVWLRERRGLRQGLLDAGRRARRALRRLDA